MSDGPSPIAKSIGSQVTSYDVARLAGVTQATVSRAINRPEAVSLATRLKVEKAMEALNYRPSAAARTLASGRNGFIGFVTQAEFSTSHLFGLLLEGINTSLAVDDYLLCFATLRPNEDISTVEKVSLIRQHTCDGFILNVPDTPGDVLAFCSRLRAPYVQINPALIQPYECVVPADQKNTEMAVAYLAAKGHRRIAYLTGFANGHGPSIEARERGYEIAMYRAGLSPLPLFDKRMPATHPGERPHEVAMRDIQERLNVWCNEADPPTAVLTYDADRAIQVMQVSYEQRWFVPDKLSLMSCDNETVLQRTPLPITAIDLNRRAIGERAAQMIFSKIAAPEERIPTEYIAGTLVERNSVLTINS